MAQKPISGSVSREWAVWVVESEPEPSGPIPAKLLQFPVEQVVRASLRAMKRSIARRLRREKSSIAPSLTSDGQRLRTWLAEHGLEVTPAQLAKALADMDTDGKNGGS